jgi:hypothetical protein
VALTGFVPPAPSYISTHARPPRAAVYATRRPSADSAGSNPKPSRALPTARVAPVRASQRWIRAPACDAPPLSGTRLNATTLASRETAGYDADPAAGLTRLVAPDARSRR